MKRFLKYIRYTMATQLEDKALQFAQEHLSAHWEPGKHVGD